MKNSLKEDTRACSFDVNSAARLHRGYETTTRDTEKSRAVKDKRRTLLLWRIRYETRLPEPLQRMFVFLSKEELIIGTINNY